MSSGTAAEKLIEGDDFLAQLRKSPAGLEIVEGGKGQILAERRKLVDELAKIDSEAQAHGQAKFGAAGKDAEAKINARIAAAKVEMQAAYAEAAERQRLWMAKSNDITWRRLQVEAQLFEGPHAEIIAEFIRWCHADRLATSRKLLEEWETPRVHPIYGEPMAAKLKTNRAGIDARVAALKQAVEKAAEMRCTIDIYAVSAALTALRGKLPIVGSVGDKSKAPEPRL